jgi:hypothetical protein
VPGTRGSVRYVLLACGPCGFSWCWFLRRWLRGVSAHLRVARPPASRHLWCGCSRFERADGTGDRLALVDPRTLRPLSDRLRTFLDGFGGTFSPDRRLFAYGNGFDARPLVQLIDVRTWSTRARLDLGGEGPVAVSWPTQDRLIAVTGAGFGRQRVLVAAAPDGQVLSRRTFRGRRLASSTTPFGLVLLLTPDQRMGAARLLVAGVDGALRMIELARIRAGGNEGRLGGRFRAPGLTVDPEAGVAYLVAAGRMLLARIDLTSGAVDYHGLRTRSPARRAVAAKGNVAAWWRDATWLGDGRIAVTGHYEPPFRPGRRVQPEIRPFGVRLINSRDWTIRTLNPDAMLAHLAGEILLANGTTWHARPKRSSSSTGLLAFDTRGRRLFTRFRGADVSVLGSYGRLGYVWVRPTRTLHVLDLRSGRTLRSERVGPSRLPFLFSATGAPSPAMS